MMIGNAPGHMGQLALGQPDYLGRTGRAARAEEDGALTSIARVATSRGTLPSSSPGTREAPQAARRHIDEDHALGAAAALKQVGPRDGGDRAVSALVRRTSGAGALGSRGATVRPAAKRATKMAA